MKNAGLSNPAIIAAMANTPAGQRIIERGADSAFSLLKGLQILFFTGVIGVGGYFAYRAFENRFKKIKEDPNEKPANVSELAAKQKADSLYKALRGFGYDFKAISFALLNINKNGFTRIYNAFGKRKGADFAEYDLTSWLSSELKPADLARLKFITNNAF